MRAKWGGPTLKPSKIKTNQKKQKKQNPPKNEKNNKQKSSKMIFQLSSKLFFGWVSKISLFWQLGPKSAHPQNTIKIGASAKKTCASRNGHFWTQKTKIQKFQLLFFAYFLLFQQQKHKKLLKPLFLYCFNKPKKENFQNLNLKHWKLKNLIFAPFFGKRLFFENCQIIGPKTTQNDNWVCNKTAWNYYKNRLKTNLDQIITPTWTR